MNDRDKVVAIVGSSHAESLRAMEALRSKQGVDFVLYGDRQETKRMAETLGIDLTGITMNHTMDTMESCKEAVIAASEGRVQVLMKGSVHTAEFLKAVLNKELDLLPEGALLSHIAKLTLPWYHKMLFLTDAAVSILPDLDKKVQIIINAISVAHNLGIENPKVALVCPVETVNPRIVSTTDASQLVFLQKNTEAFSQAMIEGPFGLDVALSQEAATIKGIEGEVPGDADILVFGNIDAANATYKAFLSVPDVASAGIVVGAKLPIVLTSRSESMETRIASIELALSVAP
jgi:phosphate butyryltransferase